MGRPLANAEKAKHTYALAICKAAADVSHARRQFYVKESPQRLGSPRRLSCHLRAADRSPYCESLLCLRGSKISLAANLRRLPILRDGQGDALLTTLFGHLDPLGVDHFELRVMLVPSTRLTRALDPSTPDQSLPRCRPSLVTESHPPRTAASSRGPWLPRRALLKNDSEPNGFKVAPPGGPDASGRFPSKFLATNVR